MAKLTLEIKAPFATFRSFSTGSFRPTAGFMPYSSAYGLVLNLAGIEMRHDDGKQVMTLIQKNLPTMQLALGIPATAKKPTLPSQQTLYQQLHNYPVGDTGKEHKKNTFGNKYNIAPIRRTFLSPFHAVITLQAEPKLIEAIQQGIDGQLTRYGLPFLGDNNFFLEELRLVETPSCFWWQRLRDEKYNKGATRLTLTIDRADSSKTKSDLFVPSEMASCEVPENAWEIIGY